MLLPEITLTKKYLLFLAFVVFIGLSIEKLLLLWGQIIASLLVWLVFLLTYYRLASASARRLIVYCLLFATLGELFVSLVWGLYKYRFGNVPHYVPPGHVIMFLLSASLAPHLPRWVIYFVPLLVTPYIFSAYSFGFDELGVILWFFFIACFSTSETERNVYVTTFILALYLEVYGTYLGNWTWRLETPYWNLSNTNPPLASGAFYCVLDFLLLHFRFWDKKPNAVTVK